MCSNQCLPITKRKSEIKKIPLMLWGKKADQIKPQDRKKQTQTSDHKLVREKGLGGGGGGGGERGGTKRRGEENEGRRRRGKGKGEGRRTRRREMGRRIRMTMTTSATTTRTGRGEARIGMLLWLPGAVMCS